MPVGWAFAYCCTWGGVGGGGGGVGLQREFLQTRALASLPCGHSEAQNPESVSMLPKVGADAGRGKTGSRT